MTFEEPKFKNQPVPSLEKTEGIKEDVLKKRFILSKEEFAERRIETVKGVVKELKQKHPEILSLCMFGSMTTGNARLESDIDGYLFVDADVVAKKLGRKEDDILDKTEANVEYFKYDSKLKIPDWAQEIRDQLKEKLNLSDEQVKHIRTRPISESIIDQHLDGLMGQIKKAEDYRQQLKRWETSEPQTSGRIEDLEKLTEYYKQKPEHPGLPDSSTNLFGMFHLETGGGIKNYREYLIGRLLTSGEIGEKAWKEIIKTTEELESHLQSNAGKKYPRILEEAKKVYGIASPDSQKKEK